jgi:DNA-binding NarL/FixJ family response regulator
MDIRTSAASAVTGFVGTTVFLVEDSPLIRERLVRMLEAIPGVKVIGHAETPAEAIDQIIVAQPNVVILDIKLKGGSGIKVLQAVKLHMPAIIVVMLTNYSTPQFRSQCVQAGADYFLDKTHEFQNIAAILEQQKCTNKLERSSC